MAFSDLQGALVNLKLVGAAGVPDLLARSEIAELWDEPTTVDTLKRRMLKDRSVYAWEIFPLLGGGLYGHLGFIKTGSPTLFVSTLAKPDDYALLQDAILTLLPAFFRELQEEWLFFHVYHAVDEEARPLLLEAGFDPVEVPDYDPKKYASYVIRRETFDIYYGEGGGDDGDEESFADEEEA